MDCDTTGIEPDIALIKYKKLVGEGYLKIVNNTVPGALRQLGYSPTQVEEIVAFVDERETIEGAPGLKPEHLTVFDCAFKPRNGVRSILPMGHVRMMAAVQPFLSGAISKTVNMPEAATVEEIEQIYLEGWKLGLKAIAIYRDNSKRSQPLSTSRLKSDDETKAASDVVAELRRQLAVAQAEAVKPHRRRLPSERAAVTHKFEISGHEGYITVGLYPDGQPGEIFLKMAKEGSTVSGLMDTYATAISLALQYGVPLRDLVNKFAHVRFEPSGFTGNSEIPIAKSSVDYIFRWLGSRFLVGDDRAALGIQDRGGSVVASPFSFGAAALAPQPEEGPSAIDEAQEPPKPTATATATAVAPASAQGSSPATGTAAGAAASGRGGLREAGPPGRRAGQERPRRRERQRERPRQEHRGVGRRGLARRPSAPPSRSRRTPPPAPTAARSWSATAAATSASTAAPRAAAAEWHPRPASRALSSEDPSRRARQAGRAIRPCHSPSFICRTCIARRMTPSPTTPFSRVWWRIKTAGDAKIHQAVLSMPSSLAATSSVAQREA